MIEPEQCSRQRGLVYGRRKGPKLSARQEELRRTLLPRLALDLHPNLAPAAYFDVAVNDVWLEVGFGAGEHLVWQAAANPGIGMIGAEPYESGVAKLLTKLAAASAGNVKIHEGDARDIIAALPDSSLGRVFILFPDPWPKRRHHKRRFLQMAMLDELARVMKPGGLLRFASDDATYVDFALERLMAHPAFAWMVKGVSDWKTRPGDWPPTRYEAKAIKGPPVYLSFRRRNGLY